MVYASKQALVRRQKEIDAGLVSDRFPQVKRIRIEVEVHNPSGKLVQRRCRDISPEGYSIFQMKCPLDGEPLDFLSVLSKMVSNRIEERKSKFECNGSPRGSQHTISIEIHIEYLPKVR